jgi:hypothetical protein
MVIIRLVVQVLLALRVLLGVEQVVQEARVLELVTLELQELQAVAEVVAVEES